MGQTLSTVRNGFNALWGSLGGGNEEQGGGARMRGGGEILFVDPTDGGDASMIGNIARSASDQSRRVTFCLPSTSYSRTDYMGGAPTAQKRSFAAITAGPSQQKRLRASARTTQTARRIIRGHGGAGSARGRGRGHGHGCGRGRSQRRNQSRNAVCLIGDSAGRRAARRSTCRSFIRSVSRNNDRRVALVASRRGRGRARGQATQKRRPQSAGR